METWHWILITVAVVVVIALVVAAMAKKRRSSKLRDRFGPEYDRTVERSDSKRDAELDLRERARERERLEIHPLSREACDRYAHEWEVIQQRFVDEPSLAVTDADALLTTVMRERGYPVQEDFDHRADVISVDHPKLVEDYRAARLVRERSADGDATTEDRREALVRYRSLFSHLLVTGDQDADRSHGADERTQGRERR